MFDYYTDWYDHDPIFIDYDEDLEDINRWPIDSESYDLVYSSHTLEHLTDETVTHTLTESFRILRPGGTIRINVPDLAVAIRPYAYDDLYSDSNLGRFTDEVITAGYDDMLQRHINVFHAVSDY